MKANLQSSVFLFALMLPAVVQAQWFFLTNHDTITIGRYLGTDSTVVIPESVGGLPVTAIGGRAFYVNRTLTSVVIPESVTRIDESAFLGCASLTSVDIPSRVNRISSFAFAQCHALPNITIHNSVISIDLCAFLACSSLTNVTIPASVNSIGIKAFASCIRLDAITVNEENPYFDSAEGALFSDDQTTLIQCPAGKVGNYAIPDTVKNIQDYAFDGCARLTSVTIPHGVTAISGGMFSDCSSLSVLVIPRSVTSILSSPFFGCASLETVYFMGDAPTVISDELWYAPRSIYYLPGTTGWRATLAGVPTALWRPQLVANDGRLGMKADQFGFNIKWASDQVVVVEASQNLANDDWFPVRTNSIVNGTSYFSDPEWANCPQRFYRLRAP